MKLITALLLTFSLSAFSQNIVLSKGTFKWTGTKTTGESHYGKISPSKSDVNTDGGKLKNVSVVMNMNSMTVDDIQGDSAKGLLGHLKNADFFNTTKHPTSKLELTEFKDDIAKGNLTIKGITKPVTVSYKMAGSSIKGSMKFDRTEYGINYKSGGFFGKITSFFGNKFINDTVDIEFEIPVIQ